MNESFGLDLCQWDFIVQQIPHPLPVNVEIVPVAHLAASREQGIRQIPHKDLRG
jgi:hypothetical protein